MVDLTVKQAQDILTEITQEAARRLPGHIFIIVAAKPDEDHSLPAGAHVHVFGNTNPAIVPDLLRFIGSQAEGNMHTHPLPPAKTKAH